MQIAIDFPNDFVSFQSAADIKKDMRLSYSLWLFKNLKVTITKAVELAHLVFTTSWRPGKKIKCPLSTSAIRNCWTKLPVCNLYDCGCRLFRVGGIVGLQPIKFVRATIC